MGQLGRILWQLFTSHVLRCIYTLPELTHSLWFPLLPAAAAAAFTISKSEIPGLVWGEAHKLVPVAFGVKKLVLSCVVEDDKVREGLWLIGWDGVQESGRLSSFCNQMPNAFVPKY